MLNPLSLVTPLILIVFSIPLAIFAGITTSLAIAVLSVRAAIVYIELAFALATSYLNSSVSSSKRDAKAPRLQLTNLRSPRGSAASPSSSSPTRKRRSHIPTKSESAVIVTSPYTPRRDYEGVGGWSTLDNTADEEALWMGMNKRLELPAAATNELQKKHHRRSLTGGSGGMRGAGSWSPEGTLRMGSSPTHSRPRTRVPTPAADMGIGAEGYFALTPRDRSIASGHGNTEMDAVRMRRLSGGTGSTGSSTAGSTKSAIKVTKTKI